MQSLSKQVEIGTFIACGAMLLGGCATVRMPNFAHPGPAGLQRAEALQWDPYPLDDIGPPVAGGRPREYARPIPEVKRGQTFTPKRPTLKPIPWPSFTVPGPPATSAQPVIPYAPPVQSPPPSIVRPPY
jgi:hypothetical protein